ncbi:uncharacterized protein ACLA_052680 [Aspergillus clavatus NRRL 1]|uniref:Uncharacterized protein n=1 Tax=Aspergillus clavatus (strain ATCC 1007 / CBS 513.65 / DSM 816 / NCTC 3887 / NRRL 1 / QM 1276 / 107) TaxID=344612 RepID=A1CIU0_ASPCL|nr:uncharacterized protein ACLA_052680 [Aspergillus clavatus NRRL 1]EAW10795.1 conserved hypothetical protein [Aspergillus clavatus NRRL 1]
MARADATADAAPASSPASSTPNLSHGPVEARSLSSITAIASNPPAYPRNPTQKKLDPLVLYIVRVPGSKDVFLTPLKPPTKFSVSAEAINASLYYLHVATPEDDMLLQEVEDEQEQQARMHKEAAGEAPPEFARMNNVRRKPVPGSGNTASPALPQAASFAAAQEPQLQLQLQPENIPLYPPIADPQPTSTPPRPLLPSGFSSSGSAGAAPRWASDVCEQSFGDAQVGNTAEAGAPQLPPRQPPRGSREEAFETLVNSQGQRKDHRWSALLNSRGLESWKERYEALSAGRHSLDSSRPKLRPHTSHESSSYIRQGSPSRSPARSPNRRPHVRSKSAERPGFYITLIRRDPSHGSQWNVATISTPRIDGGAVDIEVSTPGYNRFLARDEPFSLQSLGINLPSDGRPISLSNFKPPTQTASTEVPPTGTSRPRHFHRQLCVSRPQHRRDDDSRDLMDMPTSRASIDTFNHSPGRPHGQGHSKLKSGYYTFTSPWNGICTFSTSVNGRSLKCKHLIPTPSYPGNGSHPSGPDAPSPPPNPAITVAEIRFNTPFQAGHLHRQPSASHSSPFALSQTSAFKDSPSDTLGYSSFPASMSATQPNHPASKRASFAHFLNPNSYTRPRSRSSASANNNTSPPTPTPPPTTTTTPSHTRKPSASSTSSADERLDLSLAREPAGGGMRGKSAKLGKLIIEDEGIKMLDLVVAACMAVWWQGYYY